MSNEMARIEQEIESLRAENERLRAELAKYTGRWEVTETRTRAWDADGNLIIDRLEK